MQHQRTSVSSEAFNEALVRNQRESLGILASEALVLGVKDHVVFIAARSLLAARTSEGVMNQAGSEECILIRKLNRRIEKRLAVHATDFATGHF